MTDLYDLLDASGTETTALRPPVPLDHTRSSADLLADDAGWLRHWSRAVNGTVVTLHDDALSLQLEARTNELKKRPLVDLLDECATRGFAWRDVARILKVSVPALRKWREGGGIDGAHRFTLSRLVAFCVIAESEHGVSDVAGWLEQPLVSRCPVTGLDLAADERFEDLLALASGQIAPESVLDEAQPGWRDAPDDGAEVFIAADGLPGIRITR